MIMKILMILVIGFVLFELIEHILFPLIWSIFSRKRRSVCGVEDMVGKVVEVKRWQRTEGRVFVNGELWMAVSDGPLLPGDKAIVDQVEGLILRVTPLKGGNAKEIPGS
jgi:membrane-bound ClpP family serine protease